MLNSSGIGLQFVSDEDIASLAVSRKQSVVEGFLKEKITPVKPIMPKSKVPEHDDLSSFTRDLETNGLSKEAEMVHISCLPITGENTFFSYVLPKCSIDPTASKLTGLTIGYSSGVHTLCKDGKSVKANNLSTVLSSFSEYLKLRSSGQACLLIAYNGNNFDALRLVDKIASSNATPSFDKSYFGESLPSSLTVLNRKILKLAQIS